MIFSSIRSIATSLAIAVSPATGFAQANFSVDDIAQVSIVSGWRMENGNHMAAIRIELADGWKTYWRAPGSAGIPPSFFWENSRNLSAIEYHWPAPKVFVQNGLRSIGYDNIVTIPIELAPRNKDGAMISLRGEMQLGVCEDICIPVTVQLKADLGNPGAPDETIRASLKKRPATAKESKVASVVCKVDPISDGLRLTTRIKMPRLGRDEVAVVELPDKSIWVAPSTIERSNGALILTTELVPANAAPFLLNRADVRITVLGGGRAVDIQGCTGS